MRFPRSFLAVLATALAVGGAHAQGYPSKPVRLIIPYAPGGSADFVGRIVAQKLGDAWGQQVLPENRAGANGDIGVEVASKTPPDGYTLLLASEIQFVINPALFEKSRQDMLKEFDPITLITVAYNLLVVNAQLPARNVKELIAYAKANPGKLNYASPGTGSPNHLGMEFLAHSTGTRMVHVPYKGAGQVIPDLLVGTVQAMFSAIPAVMPHMTGGKLRVIGVGSPQRLPNLPDLPTVAEQGFAGFESGVAWSLFAPAGTPQAIIGKVHGDVVKLLQQPDVRERFNTAGLTPFGGTPAQLAAKLKEDVNKWPKVIREAGIKVEQ
jgi:tripartite-type tricarboxylate transporter receptor subunit TctC